MVIEPISKLSFASFKSEVLAQQTLTFSALVQHVCQSTPPTLFYTPLPLLQHRKILHTAKYKIISRIISKYDHQDVCTILFLEETRAK